MSVLTFIDEISLLSLADLQRFVIAFIKNPLTMVIYIINDLIKNLIAMSQVQDEQVSRGKGSEWPD